MFIEVLTKIGGKPIRLEVSQLLVQLDNGAPILVAGEYGPQGAVKCAHALDADFQQTLRALGYSRHKVVVDAATASSPPAGAQLVAGPGLR